MRIILSILSFFLFFPASAQQVIATAGQSANGGGIHVEWTLGEVAVNTLSASNIMLTQGMQQSNIVVTSIFERSGQIITAQAYPNPATNLLHLKVESDDISGMYYRISDISGRVLQQQSIYSPLERIDLSAHEAGIYMLHIYSEKYKYRQQVLTTLKIIKY